jgi:flagellar biosynthesis protein FlhB
VRAFAWNIAAHLIMSPVVTIRVLGLVNLSSSSIIKGLKKIYSVNHIEELNRLLFILLININSALYNFSGSPTSTPRDLILNW